MIGEKEKVELRIRDQKKGIEPVVSICCTTYQHIKYIRDAIEGFLNQQTNFPVQIIVRDDASKDGTTEIVAEYAAKYPALICPILNKENLYKKGISPMKDCMSHAKGKYIALCEGDDYWTDPLKLQKQLDFLEENKEYSMVCHDALVINEMTNTSSLFFTDAHKKQACTTKDVFGGHFCPTASIIFRKESLSLTDYYPNAMAGDLMLTLLLSLKGRLYRMKDVMSVYRKTSNGATQVNRRDMKKSWTNRIEIFNHFNKVSNYRFNRNIEIENRILKNRIRFLDCNSKIKRFFIMINMKVLFKQRKYLYDFHFINE